MPPSFAGQASPGGRGVIDDPVGQVSASGVEPASAFYTKLHVGTFDVSGVRLERRGSSRCDHQHFGSVETAGRVLGAGVVDRLVEAMRVANRWWGLDIDSYQFKALRYAPGHYHPEHMDMFPGSMCRKLTMIVQLSDPTDYVGGDLEVVGMGEHWSTIPRCRGLGVVFPSWTRHRVTPVGAGVRWTVAVWGYGPPVR